MVTQETEKRAVEVTQVISEQEICLIDATAEMSNTITSHGLLTFVPNAVIYYIYPLILSFQVITCSCARNAFPAQQLWLGEADRIDGQVFWMRNGRCIWPWFGLPSLMSCAGSCMALLYPKVEQRGLMGKQLNHSSRADGWDVIRSSSTSMLEQQDGSLLVPEPVGVWRCTWDVSLPRLRV